MRTQIIRKYFNNIELLQQVIEQQEKKVSSLFHTHKIQEEYLQQLQLAKTHILKLKEMQQQLKGVNREESRKKRIN